MHITRIARQKRNKRLYAVYLDGAYAFAVSDEGIVKHGLREGREIRSDDVDGILSEDEKRRAMDYALKLFGVRSRSTTELRQYLSRNEFSNTAAAHVVSRMAELGYLSDERFAADWAAALAAKGSGPELIRAELERKGIDSATIAETIARLRQDPAAEAERLKDIARRKLRTMKDTEPKTAARRLTGYLARKGYSIEAIRGALRDLIKERDEDGNDYGD
jgi:regulatory protein